MLHVDLCVYTTQTQQAVAIYKEAFQAELGYHVQNDDGTYYHAEIVKDGQTILAVSHNDEWVERGRVMQYCVNFGKDNEQGLRKAYEVLAEDGQVMYPLGPCDWNDLMADVIDRFGVRWYIAL